MQKTGHPLKGVDLQALDESTANGHKKKDEECPSATEAPEAVREHFNSTHNSFTIVIAHIPLELLELRVRFTEAQKSPIAALHVATLAQEVRVNFT